MHETNLNELIIKWLSEWSMMRHKTVPEIKNRYIVMTIRLVAPQGNQRYGRKSAWNVR